MKGKKKTDAAEEVVMKDIVTPKDTLTMNEDYDQDKLPSDGMMVAPLLTETPKVVQSESS